MKAEELVPRDWEQPMFESSHPRTIIITILT